MLVIGDKEILLIFVGKTCCMVADETINNVMIHPFVKIFPGGHGWCLNWVVFNKENWRFNKLVMMRFDHVQCGCISVAIADNRTKFLGISFD